MHASSPLTETEPAAMPDYDALDAFYRALEECPGDAATLAALADWYEEYDQGPSAACLRWTAEQQRWPFQYWRNGPVIYSIRSWQEGWYWWADEEQSFSRSSGIPGHCRLPPPLWQHLGHRLGFPPSLFKDYPTLREAYEALFAAWRKGQPRDHLVPRDAT
jgi:hypothetical protein